MKKREYPVDLTWATPPKETPKVGDAVWFLPSDGYLPKCGTVNWVGEHAYHFVLEEDKRDPLEGVGGTGVFHSEQEAYTAATLKINQAIDDALSTLDLLKNARRTLNKLIIDSNKAVDKGPPHIYDN